MKNKNKNKILNNFFFTKLKNILKQFPVSGPMGKIRKNGLVLLLVLTQGTCAPNVKRFG